MVTQFEFDQIVEGQRPIEVYPHEAHAGQTRGVTVEREEEIRISNIETLKGKVLEEGCTGATGKPCQDIVHNHILIDEDLEFPPPRDMWYDDVEDSRDVREQSWHVRLNVGAKGGVNFDF
jgi:hypothetical protein